MQVIITIMISQDYHNSINIQSTPHEAFDKICRVSEWWSTNFEGNSENLNDVFTVHFGDMFKIKITGLVPDKKILWEVIESNQSWLQDPDGWTGTKIIWEISPQKDGTHIDMTHVGLTPEIECYDACKMGWDMFIQKSLFTFLTENKGLPA